MVGLGGRCALQSLVKRGGKGTVLLLDEGGDGKGKTGGRRFYRSLISGGLDSVS